jgi:CheY-like chemotaxis protein
MALSVLVVDDDPAFLALATRLLEDMGFDEITTSADAAAAVTEAEAKRPQAVLVDIGLPDRDGIDLACQLATLPWSPHIVLTSTDTDAGSMIASRTDGSTLQFLPKEELANGGLRALLLDC